MSTISAISNWNQNLTQLAAEFTGQPAAPSTSASANTLSGSVTASPSTLAGAVGQTQGKHHKHGKLLKQIEQSVSSALQSAGPTADPNKVVQDAITKVLNGSNASKSTAAADADGDDDGTQQTFTQTLQAFGITPDQFRSDLAAAMQNAKGGSASGATVSSFPPGLFLDTAG